MVHTSIKIIGICLIKLLFLNLLLIIITLNIFVDHLKLLNLTLLFKKKGNIAGTSLPTFGGRKYLGGYSDHFAIGAKFINYNNNY